MRFDIVNTSLLEQQSNWVQCVSADLEMGLGIAKSIKAVVGADRTKELQNQRQCVGGLCYLLHDGHWVFYLVTKRLYYAKPTYETLRASLTKLAEFCKENNIRHLAMPAIGCGLDRLHWHLVERILTEVFEDHDDLVITVCNYSPPGTSFAKSM